MLGIADEFAMISRPARGLQLRDRDMRVLAQFQRDAAESVHGYPQANMFDQPDLEALLRANLKRYPHAVLRGNSEVTDVAWIAPDRVAGDVRRPGQRPRALRRSELRAGLRRREQPGARGDRLVDARPAIPSSAGSWSMWTTDADLNQWDGVHQVCDPHRAATFMRIGDTRYRWEFRLLPGETAADFGTHAALHPLIAPWVQGVAPERLELVRVAEYTFRAQLADRWRRDNVFLLGDAAHLTPPFIGQGMGAGIRDAMNLSWKLAGVVNGWLPAQRTGQLRGRAKAARART